MEKNKYIETNEIQTLPNGNKQLLLEKSSWLAFFYKKITVFDFVYKRLSYKTQILFYTSDNVLCSLENVECVTVSCKTTFIRKNITNVTPYYFYEIIIIARGKDTPYVVEKGKLGTDGSGFEALNEKAKEIAEFLNCHFLPGILGNKITLKRPFTGEFENIKDMIVYEDADTQIKNEKSQRIKLGILQFLIQIVIMLVIFIAAIFGLF